MNGVTLILKTIKNEGAVALLTGLIAFGICLALARRWRRWRLA